ncbi:cyclic nucleotide-gated cation channel beta-1-like [Bacillus rossius redtenbacheri]|uniref:cyclic nucleotide-gated cation channel beta-1-like n=1 Tax=Bacillus rossius redtenbacheri TaxID=93214 RepID=UPI002FDCB2CD
MVVYAQSTARVPEALQFGKFLRHGEHQCTLYVSWLFVVTLCFVYNCWVIPLRCTFSQNTGAWLALDCSADLVYLLDLTLVKPKMSFLDDGFWVKDPVLTKRNYLRNTQFKMDAISLLPLDIICAVVGSQQILFRLPRVLKVHTFWECYNRLDSMLPSPYMVRMVRTLIYMLYLIHLNACAYYAFSVWQGLGANGWVFSGSGSPYIRCFYFATKTATSIGKNPKPETEEESLFMTCSWLMGVFVFAILIGQMRDIVVTATQSQTEYRKLVDETVEYMRRLSLPKELQERVKLWFHFTWEQQHALDERRIIDTLPRKLKTDIALQVHMHTLSKVQLFHDCDEALLRELVLKLRPIIFLPGDYICHKGEVGKEMYIVKSGVVEVLHGAASCEVLATLSEGSVFGEISLLALCGGNRRTADVRSRGFSILFVLSKADLNDSIVHYPEAQQILKKKARSLMKQNALREKQMQGSQGKNTAFTNSQTPVKTQRLMCSTVKESKKCRRQKKMTCGKNQNAECDSQNSRRTCLSDHNKASHRDAIGLSGERSSKMTTGTVCRLQLLEDEENTFECTVSVHRTMSQ